MRIMSFKRKHLLLPLVFAGLAVGACGGGNADFQSDPTPTNRAPQISISLEGTTPNEGQPYILDASASNDPDGDMLSYKWAQTAGMDLEITDNGLATLTFVVPELSESSDVSFELELSDGTETVSETVTVTLTNIDQAPKYSGLFPEKKTLIFNRNVKTMFAMGSRELSVGTSPRDVWFVGLSDALNEPVSLVEVYFSQAGELLENPVRPFVKEYDPTSVFLGRKDFLFGQSFSSEFGITPNDVALDLLILEETSNKISVVNRAGAAGYQEDWSLDIESPCAAVTRPINTINDINFDFLIGRRNDSLLAIDFIFDDSNGNIDYRDPFIRDYISDQRSICNLVRTTNALNNEPLPSGQSEQNPVKFLGIDEETNTIVKYGFDSSSRETIIEQEVPLDLNTDENLQLVGSTRIQRRIAQGESGIEVRGIALVLTNGEHNGLHRVVFVGLDRAGNITQSMKSWDVGVPSDVLIGDFDDDPVTPDEIMVISSASPEAIIYRFADNRQNLPISGPEFLEIGLGADQGFSDNSTVHNDGLSGIFVTYPEEKTVRFFGTRRSDD